MTALSFWETASLILAFGIAFSIIWNTLQWGISPMPSSRAVRRELFKHLPKIDSGEIYELGSGFGTLAIPLAKQYPELKITGFEMSPVPFLIATARGRILGLKNLRFKRADFLQADLGPAALLVSYLYPGGMEKIAQRLPALGPDKRYFLSHTFALPGYVPIQTAQASDLYRSPIYLYELPGPSQSHHSGEA